MQDQTYRNMFIETSKEAEWGNRLEPKPKEFKTIHGLGYVSNSETQVIEVHTPSRSRSELPA